MRLMDQFSSGEIEDKEKDDSAYAAITKIRLQSKVQCIVAQMSSWSKDDAVYQDVCPKEDHEPTLDQLDLPKSCLSPTSTPDFQKLDTALLVNTKVKYRTLCSHLKLFLIQLDSVLALQVLKLFSGTRQIGQDLKVPGHMCTQP